MAYRDVQQLHESDEALSCLNDTGIISRSQPQAPPLSPGHDETQWVLQDTIGSSFSLHAEGCAHTRRANAHQPDALPHAPIYTLDAMFDPATYPWRERQSPHGRSCGGSLYTLPDVSNANYHPSVYERQPHTFIPPLRNPYTAEIHENPYASSISPPLPAADGGHVSLGHNYGFPTFQSQNPRGDMRLFQHPLAPLQNTFATPVHSGFSPYATPALDNANHTPSRIHPMPIPSHLYANQHISSISSSLSVADGRHVSLAHNYPPPTVQPPIFDTANRGRYDPMGDGQLSQHPVPPSQNVFAIGTERECRWRDCGERFTLREENKEDFATVENHIDSHLDIEGYPVYSAHLGIKCLWSGCTKETSEGEVSQTYTWRKDLKRHIFESHRMQGEKIMCPYDGCTSSFTRKGSLDRHIEKKHM